MAGMKKTITILLALVSACAPVEPTPEPQPEPEPECEKSLDCYNDPGEGALACVDGECAVVGCDSDLYCDNLRRGYTCDYAQTYSGECRNPSWEWCCTTDCDNPYPCDDVD